MSNFTGSTIERLADGRMYDPRGGWTVTRRWRGTPSQVNDKAVTEALLGNRFAITPSDDGGFAVLESTAADIENQPADQPLSDTWELDANSLEKELWFLKWVKAVMDGVTDTQLSGVTITAAAARNWIRRAIESFISGTEKIKFVDGVEEFALTYDELVNHIFVLQPSAAEGLKPLIDIMAKGVKQFQVGQFVLKRTRVVARNYSVKPIYDDVFKRRDSTSLKTHYSIPDALLFALPDGEWLKYEPTVKQTSATKWTISEEWYHADKWEPLIYGDLV